MSWAAQAKQQLREGQVVQIRPRGNSMVPIIHSGDLVTLEPVTDVSAATIKVGDVVLVHVAGRDYLHLVKALGPGPRFQIGNNRGGINGWASARAVYGRLIRVEK